MKNLSDQYKKKLIKLDEQGIPRTTASSDDDELNLNANMNDKQGNPDYLRWAAVGIMAWPFIKPVLSVVGVGGAALLWKKLAATKDKSGNITKYNFIQVFRDKRALQKAGVTKKQMYDIWRKAKVAIAESERRTIDQVMVEIAAGEITAKEAMFRVRPLVTKGAKTTEYIALKKIEDKAVASGKIAPPFKTAEEQAADRAAAAANAKKAAKTTRQANGPAYSHEFGEVLPNITEKEWGNVSLATKNKIAANLKAGEITREEITASNVESLALSKAERDTAADATKQAAKDKADAELAARLKKLGVY